MGADAAGQEGAGGELEPAELGRVFGLNELNIARRQEFRWRENPTE